jgi:hypothetical protein
MPYQPGTPKLAAVAVAALVAVALTAEIAILAAALDDLSQAMTAGRDMWAFLPNVLADLLVVPLMAVALGYLGAFLFLGAALLPFRQHSSKAYMCAGAVAGLAHSCCGLAITFVMALPGDASGWGETLNRLFWAGGFFLISSPRDIVVAATVVGSVLAGAVAGRLYARMIRVADGVTA